MAEVMALVASDAPPEQEVFCMEVAANRSTTLRLPGDVAVALVTPELRQGIQLVQASAQGMP